MSSRTWIVAIASLWMCQQGAAAIADPSYPSRPVKIVVPFQSGGASDLIGRVLAGKFAESLGQPFVVENRAGAAGNIGTELVAKAEPDGHMLLLASDTSIVLNPSFYPKMPYDPLKDLVGITYAASSAFVMVAPVAFPANSVHELIALAKANPGKFNYGSLGVGSHSHIASELLNALAGVRLVHVPYKGFPTASPDLISGKVETMFASVPAAAGLLKGGKLKALAVSSAKRHEAMPQVPTLVESGFPDFEITAWFGLMAPARTPRSIVDKLHAEVVKAFQQKDVSERFVALGLDIIVAGPQEFAVRIGSDTTRWARIIKASGAKPDD